MNISYILLILFGNYIAANQYFYPVAGIKKNNERYLYMLYQKDTIDVELFLWHEKSKSLSKVLPSMCIPANICVLPDQNGFSFIDNGRLKLKLFKKRSPKVIDFIEPIYQIELVHWIDNQRFYFSAKENGKFAIFQGDIKGMLNRIVSHPTAHCSYPQKIGNMLFYIQYDDDSSHYSIQYIIYPHISCDTMNFNDIDDFDMRVNALLKSMNTHGINEDNNQGQCIHDNDAQPIAFLKMLNENQGYYIQHTDTITSDDIHIKLHYYSLYKDADNAWHTKQLFSFVIPIFLLSINNQSLENPNKLYESILPMLPCHDDEYHNRIYYISLCDDNNKSLNLYSYNCNNKTSTQITQTDHTHYFGMVKVDKTIYYGGTMQEKRIWINKHGRMCYDVMFT